MNFRISRVCAMIVVLIASLLAVAGCGSSDPETPSTTRAQFARKANAICERLYKQQEREMVAYRKAHGFELDIPTQGQQERVNTAVVMPVVQQKIEELGALPVPEGDEAKVEAFLAAMERGMRKSEDDPASLASPADPEPFEDARNLTAAYGIRVCGQA